MPDGEVGPRQHWISRIHYQVLAGHPELETVRRSGAGERRRAAVIRATPPTAGCSRSRTASSACASAIRAGGSATRATPSTPISCSRRCARRASCARHLRFQVSLASVNSALPPRIFPDQADLAKIRPGFTEALAAEVDTIVKHIPNDDLAIQWDCSTEVQDAYGAVPGYSADGAIERNVAQFRTLSPRIPESVELGYHFCFGTLGGWPRFAPADLSATVELANATVEASGRRVDWIHIPVLPDVEEVVLRAAEEPQAARRARLSRRHPSHGRLQGAHRAGAQISCRSSGSPPIAASAACRRPRCRRCSNEHLQAIKAAG